MSRRNLPQFDDEIFESIQNTFQSHLYVTCDKNENKSLTEDNKVDHDEFKNVEQERINVNESFWIHSSSDENSDDSLNDITIPSNTSNSNSKNNNDKQSNNSGNGDNGDNDNSNNNDNDNNNGTARNIPILHDFENAFADEEDSVFNVDTNFYANVYGPKYKLNNRNSKYNNSKNNNNYNSRYNKNRGSGYRSRYRGRGVRNKGSAMYSSYGGNRSNDYHNNNNNNNNNNNYGYQSRCNYGNYGGGRWNNNRARGGWNNNKGSGYRGRGGGGGGGGAGGGRGGNGYRGRPFYTRGFYYSRQYSDDGTESYNVYKDKNPYVSHGNNSNNHNNSNNNNNKHIKNSNSMNHGGGGGGIHQNSSNINNNINSNGEEHFKVYSTTLVSSSKGENVGTMTFDMMKHNLFELFDEAARKEFNAMPVVSNKCSHSQLLNLRIFEQFNHRPGSTIGKRNYGFDTGLRQTDSRTPCTLHGVDCDCGHCKLVKREDEKEIVDDDKADSSKKNGNSSSSDDNDDDNDDDSSSSESDDSDSDSDDDDDDDGDDDGDDDDDGDGDGDDEDEEEEEDESDGYHKSLEKAREISWQRGDDAVTIVYKLKDYHKWTMNFEIEKTRIPKKLRDFVFDSNDWDCVWSFDNSILEHGEWFGIRIIGRNKCKQEAKKECAHKVLRFLTSNSKSIDYGKEIALLRKGVKLTDDINIDEIDIDDIESEHDENENENDNDNECKVEAGPLTEEKEDKKRNGMQLRNENNYKKANKKNCKQNKKNDETDEKDVTITTVSKISRPSKTASGQRNGNHGNVGKGGKSVKNSKNGRNGRNVQNVKNVKNTTSYVNAIGTDMTEIEQLIRVHQRRKYVHFDYFEVKPWIYVDDANDDLSDDLNGETGFMHVQFNTNVKYIIIKGVNDDVKQTEEAIGIEFGVSNNEILRNDVTGKQITYDEAIQYSVSRLWQFKKILDKNSKHELVVMTDELKRETEKVLCTMEFIHRNEICLQLQLEQQQRDEKQKQWEGENQSIDLEECSSPYEGSISGSVSRYFTRKMMISNDIEPNIKKQLNVNQIIISVHNNRSSIAIPLPCHKYFDEKGNILLSKIRENSDYRDNNLISFWKQIQNSCYFKTIKQRKLIVNRREILNRISKMNDSGNRNGNNKDKNENGDDDKKQSECCYCQKLYDMSNLDIIGNKLCCLKCAIRLIKEKEQEIYQMQVKMTLQNGQD